MRVEPQRPERPERPERPGPPDHSGRQDRPELPGLRPYDGPWRFTAQATDSSVPRLRHEVRDLVGRQATPVSDDVVQSLLLILSELVTNAVRHAALLSPEIGVEVSLGGGWIRVAVEDSHPYRPKALAADPFMEHTSGRGLLLVKAITDEAGGICDVEQTGSGGKVIWAALPLTPP